MTQLVLLCGAKLGRYCGAQDGIVSCIGFAVLILFPARSKSMKLSSGILAVVLALALAGCGTYVPSIRSWPATSDGDEEAMINTIVRSVSCELGYTVTRIIDNDRDLAKSRVSHARYTDFLFDWGVEAALNFTVIERTNVNPTLLLTPDRSVASLVTVSGGFAGGAEATRISRLNVFYRVKDLYRPDLFSFSDPDRTRRPCRDPNGNKEGSLLVDSDLRLLPLLEGRIGSEELRFAGSPGSPAFVMGEKNVISQTIDFKIVASGDVTPAWKLVRTSVDTGGKLLSFGRDQTHELVITFGPLDSKSKGTQGLTFLAEGTHLNTQLQTGLSTLLNSR